MWYCLFYVVVIFVFVILVFLFVFVWCVYWFVYIVVLWWVVMLVICVMFVGLLSVVLCLFEVCCGVLGVERSCGRWYRFVRIWGVIDFIGDDDF